MNADEFFESSVDGLRKDRWGRTVLTNRHGREYSPVAATTISKIMDDTTNLDKWRERMIIKGLGMRPDLAALAGSTDHTTKSGKADLSRIAGQARDVAAGPSGAVKGTTFDQYATGVLLGRIDEDEVDPRFRPALAAYRRELTRHGLCEFADYAQVRVANTTFEVGGIADRYVRADPHSSWIALDLKTDKDLSYGWLKYSMQLSIYSHADEIYDETGHGALFRNRREDVALIAHVDVDAATCHLYEIDTAAGWSAVHDALRYRQWRKMAPGLARPYQSDPLTTEPPMAELAAATFGPVPVTAEDPIERHQQASDEAAVYGGASNEGSDGPDLCPGSGQFPVPGTVYDPATDVDALLATFKGKADMQAAARTCGVTDLAHTRKIIAQMMVALPTWPEHRDRLLDSAPDAGQPEVDPDVLPDDPEVLATQVAEAQRQEPAYTITGQTGVTAEKLAVPAADVNPFAQPDETALLLQNIKVATTEQQLYILFEQAQRAGIPWAGELAAAGAQRQADIRNSK